MPEQKNALLATLREGAAEFGVLLDADAGPQLIQYLDLLLRWNQAYSLTAVRDPEEMVTRHLLDSLSIAPYLRGNSIVDTGTGAGLPGLPLAVAQRECQFVLVDSNGKKTRFVTQAVTELGLTNVVVEKIRCEHYRPAVGFDTVVSRAFAALPTLLNTAGHLCAHGGRILAMKGRNPRHEIAQIPPAWRVMDTHVLSVPGLEGQRHLVELAPATGE